MTIENEARTPELELKRKQVEAEIEGELLEAVVGAAAGAMTGALAGPVGIAVGAGLGAAAGAALGHQLRNANRERAAHDRDLDADVVDSAEVDALVGRDAILLESTALDPK